jgi:hypothetical protein
MGYYVNGNGELRIKKENLDAAYGEIMKLQNAPDESKHGGAYSNGGYTARWFSWMPEDLSTIPSAKEVFERLGFEVDSDGNGDLLIRCYDNKTGQEDVFFAAAAKFIEDGEYEWEGEDGDFWKWTFQGGKMFVARGEKSYNYTHATPVDVSQLIGS